MNEKKYVIDLLSDLFKVFKTRDIVIRNGYVYANGNAYPFDLPLYLEEEEEQDE